MESGLLTNLLLPLALGVIMLGLGLGLTVDDFRRVARFPRAVLVGLGLQVLVLPWAALGLAIAAAVAVGFVWLTDFGIHDLTGFLAENAGFVSGA